MSTRVTGSVQMTAQCRELVNQRLNIPLDASIALESLTLGLGLGEHLQLDITPLHQLVADQAVQATIGVLAPEPFAAARDILAADGTPGTETSELAAAAQAELADAFQFSRDAMAHTARDITAEVFAAAGRDLSYTVSLCQGTTATGVEMRRGHEVMLLRVHDSGRIESDHAGLLDATCGDRQRELEHAAAQRGIVITGRQQDEHGSAKGGQLIRSAAAHRGMPLAQATVAETEQHGSAAKKRLFSAQDKASSQRAHVRRRGTVA